MPEHEDLPVPTVRLDLRDEEWQALDWLHAYNEQRYLNLRFSVGTDPGNLSLLHTNLGPAYTFSTTEKGRTGDGDIKLFQVLVLPQEKLAELAVFSFHVSNLDERFPQNSETKKFLEQVFIARSWQEELGLCIPNEQDMEQFKGIVRNFSVAAREGHVVSA